MDALEAIDDRILDLEAEKKTLDARIEEIERLRAELAGESVDDGDKADEGEPEPDKTDPIPDLSYLDVPKPAAAPKAPAVVKPGSSMAERIRAAIATHGPLRAAQLADIINGQMTSIATALVKEADEGRLERVDRGLYGLTEKGRKLL